LFGLLDNQGEDRIKVLAGQFEPIQTNIENAQDALRNNDNSTALNALNSADSELLKVTQQLPPDEEAAPEEEEEAAPEEEEEEGE
jgi:hypothetical protein